MPEQIFRVGYVLAKGSVSLPYLRLKGLAESSGDYSLTLIQIDEKRQSARSFVASRLEAGILSLEIWVLSHCPKYRALLKESHFPGAQCPANPMIPRDQKLERLYASNLLDPLLSRFDLLVLGLGASPSEVDTRSMPPKGILSIKAIDEKTGRSSQNFAHDALTNGDASIGFEVTWQHPGDPHESTVLRGYLPTAPFACLNLVRVGTKASALLHQTLKKISQGGTLDDLGRSGDGSIHLQQSSSTFCYVACVSKRLIKSKILRLMGLVRSREVGYQRDRNHASDFSNHTEVPNPLSRFRADPFVIRFNERTICYVEEHDNSGSAASINALELTPEGCFELGTVLRESCHLSFPWIVESDGKLFMCPETLGLNEIRLYQCRHFPLEWSHHRTLISNVRAADTTLFLHEGRWWLLTNLDSADIGEYESELHIFYADKLDSESWTPHPKNPVIIDSRIARNGGLLLRSGAIYRVRQKYGYLSYGAGISLAKIETLTPSEFHEVTVTDFENCSQLGNQGVHTLSMAGNIRFFDYVSMSRP